MKSRLIASIICIVAAFLLSFGSERYIVRKSDELTTLIDKALSSESGSDEMYSLSTNACKGWRECEKLFGSLLKHSDADSLEHCYSLIEEYVKSKNVDELNETLEECKVIIKVIGDGEKPNVDNIF